MSGSSDIEIVTKCMAQRQQAMDKASGSTSAVYIPKCKSDGSFDEVQCHTGTGYCWCVSHDGKPLPGSSVHGKQATCKQTKGN